MTVRGKYIWLAAGITAVILGLAGCTSGSLGSGKEPTDSFSTQKVNSFSAETIDGGAFFGEDRVGENTVYWFWTPWCTVCRGEAPEVAAAASLHADDVTFVGVAAHGNRTEMQAFIAQTGVDQFVHLNDPSASIWGHFGVSSQPSFVFVDSDGLATRSVGALSPEALDREIELMKAGYSR